MGAVQGPEHLLRPLLFSAGPPAPLKYGRDS